MERRNQTILPLGDACGMPFFVSMNADKVDAVTRKSIRSHAMRGRTSKVVRTGKSSSVPIKESTITRTGMLPVNFDDIMSLYMPPTLRRVGSDLAFSAFAEELEPSMLLNMTKLAPVSMEIAFPLLMAIGFQADNREWLHIIGSDAAALHITAFAVEGFIDMVLRRRAQVNPTAMLHYHHGVKLLRERLLGEDDEAKTTDGTIGVVLKLASAAHLTGEHEIAKAHMDGLRRMVDCRGGLDALEAGGSNPVFYAQPSEPIPEYPSKLVHIMDGQKSPHHLDEVIEIIDSDLATAWSIMKKFCLLVNLGTQTQRQISSSVIYETMTTTMYRLIQMRYPTGSVDGAVRLGLLAFSYHVFLQWRDIKMPGEYFTGAFLSCILEPEQMDELSPQLMTWLLMVGAVSIFGLQEEVWLRQALRNHAIRCQIGSWKDMQDLLKSFMWIPLLDEQHGRYIFDTLELDKTKS